MITLLIVLFALSLLVALPMAALYLEHKEEMAKIKLKSCKGKCNCEKNQET